MARRIVTVSFTGLDAGGGVPKFNRDLHAAFPDRECVHFCWDGFFGGSSVIQQSNHLMEWEKAKLLNHWLVQRKHVTADDVIIADGFWAAGLEGLPLAVSHSHGIWSHLTQEDVETGKSPDMPFHHTAQVSFRSRWVQKGKPLTAVSDFIAHELAAQWGWDAHVINNGVDIALFRPMEKNDNYGLRRPFIIHGVNDPGNANKGWDHIEFLKREMPDATIQSLDEAHASWGHRSDRVWSKADVLAQADLVVHPSNYEGNSMFVAEALSCGVPVVGYDVGFLWKVRHIDRNFMDMGYVLDRRVRAPELTALACALELDSTMSELKVAKEAFARNLAVSQLSIERFGSEWRAYVEGLEAKHGT